MKRSTAREIAVRLVFALCETDAEPQSLLETAFEEEYYSSLKSEDELYNEKPSKKQLAYISRIVIGISEHGAELDGYVEKYSIGWKFSRISRTALAIMKTAMFEILYMQDVPNSAAINEAVGMAKQYEQPETVSFINGVLGSFISGELSDAVTASDAALSG